MNNILFKNWPLVISIMVVSLISGCDICGGGPVPYESPYEPVYMSYADLDESVKLIPPQPISNSGKIYKYSNLLFVGEQGLGFHIFDNSDPKNPKNNHFLQVLGSTDISIKQDIMYVNQATDLLSIRFNLLDGGAKVEARVKNAFPHLLAPDGTSGDIQKDSMIIRWKTKK